MMNIGDRFFTIAYTLNTKVIEVEVINIEYINNITYIHFQNVAHYIDKWFLPIDEVNKWKFNTKEEAMIELNKFQ